MDDEDVDPIPSTSGDRERDLDRRARAPRRHCVLMLSDFFLPTIGGVELHIHALASRLRARGHKVVVFTHGQPGREGVVRWIEGGVKVYHAPRVVMYDNCTFPGFFGNFRLFRKVCRRTRGTRRRNAITAMVSTRRLTDSFERRCAFERA